MAIDLAKYVLIMLAVFVTIYPSMAAIDPLGPATAQNILLAGNLFGALSMMLLLPLALWAMRSPWFGTMQAHGVPAILALAGFMATPIAIGLLQRAVAAFGLS